MKPSDKDAVDLTRALSAALAERPEARPTGDAFLESMENLEHGRTLEAKRQQAWNEVRLAIDRDKHKQWFTSVVNKMRPHFEAMALGLFQTPLERYREVADFLNQVLEAFPGAGLSLKNLSMRRPDVVELPTVLAVRNYDAHAGQALWREGTERLKKFQAAPEAQRRKTFNTAVELVGKEVQIGSLTPLLEKFYPQTSAD